MYLIVFFISFTTAGAIGLIFSLLHHRSIKREIAVNNIISKLRREVSEIIIEMNGTTERNILLLENRIQELKRLLDKAAKVRKVLEAEKNKQASAERIYSELGKKRPIKLQDPPPFEHESSADSLSPRDKVLQMYQRGDSLDAIVDKVGMNRGEIELIISLLNQN
ncbi:MAG: hypothetical protein B0D92_00915 [Spirochaeta sp. LUC14_002_19_P3]|nr:MAG: hypothetical protein B0D92_00915 [Spirochaeta sp. LUC14_002_19_P3]